MNLAAVGWLIATTGGGAWMLTVISAVSVLVLTLFVARARTVKMPGWLTAIVPVAETEPEPRPVGVRVIAVPLMSASMLVMGEIAGAEAVKVRGIESGS